MDKRSLGYLVSVRSDADVVFSPIRLGRVAKYAESSKPETFLFSLISFRHIVSEKTYIGR